MLFLIVWKTGLVVFGAAIAYWLSRAFRSYRFITIILFIFLPFGIFHSLSAWTFGQLERTTGTVTQLTTRNAPQKSFYKEYWVSFQYKDSRGTSHEEKALISPARWEKLKAGDAYPVSYVLPATEGHVYPVFGMWRDVLLLMLNGFVSYMLFRRVRRREKEKS